LSSTSCSPAFSTILLRLLFPWSPRSSTWVGSPSLPLDQDQGVLSLNYNINGLNCVLPRSVSKQHYSVGLVAGPNVGDTGCLLICLGANVDESIKGAARDPVGTYQIVRSRYGGVGPISENPIISVSKAPR
jgi:hypothetical protein